MHAEVSACTASVHKIQTSVWRPFNGANRGSYLKSFWRTTCFFSWSSKIAAYSTLYCAVISRKVTVWAGWVDGLSGWARKWDHLWAWYAKAYSLSFWLKWNFSDQTEQETPSCLLIESVRLRKNWNLQESFISTHWFDYWHQMSLTVEIIVPCVHHWVQVWELSNNKTSQCWCTNMAMVWIEENP